MAKTVGYNARVKVNGTFYRCKRWEVDDTAVDLEVGDSEDGVFEVHEPGRNVARITLENATYDAALNPYAAPFSLSSGNHAHVEIFPADVGASSHDFPDVLITSAKQAGDVAALTPVTITGVTSGPYTMAS